MKNFNKNTEEIFQEFFLFSTLIEKLKKIERYKDQFYWRDYPKLKRYESVADHTWRLAILVILFEDKLVKRINSEKALKMALIHDLPEVIAGDAHPMEGDGTGKNTYAFRDDLRKKKSAKEKRAAIKLFKNLPVKKGKELLAIWEEYEDQKCFEAKFVKALDKIEMLLQVFEYRKGFMFPQHMQFGFDYAVKYTNIDPFIMKFTSFIINKYKKNYKEFKK